MTTTLRTDLYQRITDTIVAALEAGTTAWHQPWRVPGGMSMAHPLRATGERYRGINRTLLWLVAAANGYTAPTWMTFRQALARDAHVRKGERGTTVVHGSTATRTCMTDSGQEIERQVSYLKAYTVFNVAQIDGLPDGLGQPPALPAIHTPIEAADRFIAATGATIVHGGDQAFYIEVGDRIQCPVPDAFESPDAYYGTMLHETIHWTRPKHRLDRDFGRRRWGDAGYAMEELVAEIGAAYLCADLGIAAAPRPDHARYIAHWLAVLAQDKRAIFSAAAHAQRAVDYLHARQPGAARPETAGQPVSADGPEPPDSTEQTLAEVA